MMTRKAARRSVVLRCVASGRNKAPNIVQQLTN